MFDVIGAVWGWRCRATSSVWPRWTGVSAVQCTVLYCTGRLGRRPVLVTAQLTAGLACVAAALLQVSTAIHRCCDEPPAGLPPRPARLAADRLPSRQTRGKRRLLSGLQWAVLSCAVLLCLCVPLHRGVVPYTCEEPGGGLLRPHRQAGRHDHHAARPA